MIFGNYLTISSERNSKSQTPNPKKSTEDSVLLRVLAPLSEPFRKSPEIRLSHEETQRRKDGIN